MAKIRKQLYYLLSSRKCKYSKIRKKLQEIMKKRNSSGWRFISKSSAIVDTKKLFESLSILGK
tara:strand:- start:75 stop:263 length:189 start_codon:yes stop_codon:yes gene_type:complete